MIEVKSIKPFTTSKNRAIGKGNGEIIKIDEDELDEIKDCVEVISKPKPKSTKKTYDADVEGFQE